MWLRNSQREHTALALGLKGESDRIATDLGGSSNLSTKEENSVGQISDLPQSLSSVVRR